MSSLMVKRVRFNGDDLIAVKDEMTEKIYTGVVWICEGLGLDVRRQREKLKEHLTLKRGVATLPLPSNGGTQETLAIELEFLPLWLATINPSLVKDEIKEKLIRYQLKAKDALAAEFIKKKLDSYMIEDPIQRARSWIREQEEKLILEQRLFEYEPKISYLDTILNSTNAIVVTQIAADYGLSATRLNKILKENQIQYKVNKQWILKAKYKDKGFTKSNTFIDTTGEVRLNTKWTQRGRLFIHELLESIGIKALMDLENRKAS